MPHAKEKSRGTKAGRNATAYTAAFTFVRLVIKPNLKEAQLLACFLPLRSKCPNSFLSVKAVCKETRTKKATPVHLRSEYAISDRVNMADKPIALEIDQMKIPAQLPTADSRAALLPPMIDCLRTMATPWPGTMTNRSVAPAKAGMFSSNCFIDALVGD